MGETPPNKEVPNPNNNNLPASDTPDVKKSAQAAQSEIAIKAKKTPKAHSYSQEIDHLSTNYEKEDSRLLQEKQNVATGTFRKLNQTTSLPDDLQEEFLFYDNLFLQNAQYLRKGLILNPENLINWNQIASYYELKDSPEYQKVNPDEPLVTDNIDNVSVILRINAMRALKSAIAEIQEKNIGIQFNISTSYRDIEKQIQLKKAAPTLTNKAGTSTHHTGGAIDVKAK